VSNYWLGVALLSVIAIVILLVPFVRNRDRQAQDVLSNTQIIKQRMLELEREVKEGLISADDKHIAINELKLALVDEVEEASVKSTNSVWLLVVSGIVAVNACVYVYWQSNEVADIKHWQSVTQQSAELAKRIVVQADPTITGQDVEDFALAIRTKLLNTPDDHIGWLLLGRLHASMNRLDEALQAFGKAYALAPEHAGILSSYSQTLVMTGQEQYLAQAQDLIQKSILLNPEDINAFGMLAVVATSLGDNKLAIESWQQLRAKLPESDPMLAEVDKRIVALAGEPTAVSSPSILVTVNVAPALLDKLPANGFLFVFAQDPSGQVRMPAAVVKSKLGKLPVQIELSVANAMMPTYTLAQLSKAKLVARISLDENVAPTQGEFQGEVIIELQSDSQIQQDVLIDKELL
jgi:cytochrome c-type biogenesis protein CcmI